MKGNVCGATHLSCGNGRIAGMGNDQIERSERLAKWLTDGNYGDGVRFRGMADPTSGKMDNSPPRECDRGLVDDMARSMNRDLDA